MSLIQKPFARWDTFDACKVEQMEIGHSEESAKKICGSIQERAEKGLLFKTVMNLDILKGEGKDLIVGGYASWEIVDQDTPPDYVTTEAMANFLRKFFNLPEEYRNISIDHHSLIIGKGLLQYPEVTPRYFSHVHEKGMYLIAKIRNDTLSYTQHFRRQIRDRIYKMFSIRGKATRYKNVVMDKRIVRKIFDIDPIEVGIVKEGMNQKSAMQVLKRKPICSFDAEELVHIKVSKMKELTHKINKELTIEELKQKIAELDVRRTHLYQLENEIHEEEHSKHEMELSGLNAEIEALQQLLTEKLKVQIQAEPAKPVEKKRDLTGIQETKQIFKKHFPNYGD